MVLNILKTLKKPNKAFLKFIAIRVLLERLLVKIIQFPISLNEYKSVIFSKNRSIDFIKKSSYNTNYSLNIRKLSTGKVHVENSFFKYTDVKFVFLLTPVFLNLSR